MSGEDAKQESHIKFRKCSGLAFCRIANGRKRSPTKVLFCLGSTVKLSYIRRFRSIFFPYILDFDCTRRRLYNATRNTIPCTSRSDLIVMSSPILLASIECSICRIALASTHTVVHAGTYLVRTDRDLFAQLRERLNNSTRSASRAML